MRPRSRAASSRGIFHPSSAVDITCLLRSVLRSCDDKFCLPMLKTQASTDPCSRVWLTGKVKISVESLPAKTLVVDKQCADDPLGNVELRG